MSRSRRSIARRSRPPGKPPELRIPTWTKTHARQRRASWSSRRSTTCRSSRSRSRFIGGADQFEPAGKRAVATLTAAMLSEGTTTRDGEPLSNALQLLGTSVNASRRRRERLDRLPVDDRQVSEPTLAHARRHARQSDVPGRRARAAAARSARGSCTQAQAQPGVDRQPWSSRSVALRHRRIRSGVSSREESAQGDHARRRRWRSTRRTSSRARALITVVGDVEGRDGRRRRSRRRSRPGPGRRRSRVVRLSRRCRRRQPTTIYLVDKPGAAQSTFAIGSPGPAAQHARLLRAAGHEHDARRACSSRGSTPTSARRRATATASLELRVRQGPRSVPRRRRHRHGEERRGADRVHEGAEGHPRQRGRSPTTSWTTAKDALVQRLPRRFASVSGIGNAHHRAVTCRTCPTTTTSDYARQ